MITRKKLVAQRVGAFVITHQKCEIESFLNQCGVCGPDGFRILQRLLRLSDQC